MTVGKMNAGVSEEEWQELERRVRVELDIASMDKPLTRADLAEVKELLDSWGPFPASADSVKYVPSTSPGQRAIVMAAVNDTGPDAVKPLLRDIIADLEQAEACIAVLQALAKRS